MKYSDGAEDDDDEGLHCRVIKHGYVFYYPSVNQCKVIEVTVTDETVANELKQFEDWVCKVLFLINEQIPLRETTNKHALAKQ